MAQRLVSFLLVLMLFLIGLSRGVSSQSMTAQQSGQASSWPPPAGAFAPGRVLVRWRQGVSYKQVAPRVTEAGGRLLRVLDPLPAAVIETPVGQESAVIAALKGHPLILSAEPDYRAYAVGGSAPSRVSANSGLGWKRLAAGGYQPNDTYWVDQWAARRVQAPAAWELSTGNDSVIVAVVDSGIDLDHPEFAGRLLPGYDYVNQDSDPQDDYGHGTHVAGIIAATGDNGEGVAGMAWNVQLLPLKVLDKTGVGTASNVALGVLNAASHNASVINLSLALTGTSQVLHDAIQVAYDNGAIIVAAAGNDGGTVSYPAAYPEVLAVAATTHWEEWAPYSNSGPQVDLAAPGGESDDPILSTSLGDSYATLYGTSVAAPYVAGVAALMRAMAPTTSNVTIAGILRNTADKVGSEPYVNGRNNRLGYGRLNAGQALRQVLPPVLRFDPAGLSLFMESGGELPEAIVTLSNPSSQPLSWQVAELSQDWLDADGPWSGILAYPNQVAMHVRVIKQQPVGSYEASIKFRVTQLGGQQQDYLLPVQLQTVTQLHNTFLPLAFHEQLVTSWVDGALGGIAINLSEDGAQPIGLPFNFPFYGRRYNTVWIHANGFLSFGQGYPGSSYAVNDCVPSLDLPNDAIYALWTDLDPSQAGKVYFRNVANEYFVIEWRDVPERGSSAPNTFEVILWPDGRVLIQYKEVANPANATVGLENWDASMGWLVTCHGGGLLPTAGRALRFHTALPATPSKRNGSLP